MIADDVVEIRRDGDQMSGMAPKRIRHYMEIRGLGILFVPDQFGLDSVSDELRIELICHLERWKEGAQYERVGLERPRTEIDGVPLPTLTLPARLGASMATIVEVAAKEHRQRSRGVHAAHLPPPEGGIAAF